MTTLASLITQLREDRLNEPSEGFWRNVTLRRLINTAIKDVARRTLCFTTESTIAIVAGTQTYDLPSNLCALLDPTTFTPTGSSQRYPIEQIDYNAARTRWGINSAITQNLPTQCATRDYPGPDDALQILLFPIPSVAGTLRVNYAFFPTPLSSTGTDDLSSLPVPMGWEDIVLDYAEYRAQSLRPGPEAATKAAAALQTYRDNISQLAITSTRWATRGGEIEFDPFWYVNGMDW